MRSRIKYIIPVLPALAAGVLVRTTRKQKRTQGFLSTFKKAKGDHYLDTVSINGKVLYKSTQASNVAKGTCLAPTEPISEIEVCGVQLRAVVYLMHECHESDAHQLEVKTCDATQPADSCVSYVDNNVPQHLSEEFLSNAKSYQILPCDPEVQLPEVDMSAASESAASEAASEADGQVAEAEQDAEEMAMHPETPAPPPVAPSPPPIPPPADFSFSAGPMSAPSPPAPYESPPMPPPPTDPMSGMPPLGMPMDAAGPVGAPMVSAAPSGSGGFQFIGR